MKINVLFFEFPLDNFGHEGIFDASWDDSGKEIAQRIDDDMFFPAKGLTDALFGNISGGFQGEFTQKTLPFDAGGHFGIGGHGAR